MKHLNFTMFALLSMHAVGTYIGREVVQSNSPRIIGGQDVQAAYPFFVQGPGGNCGGSLIAPNLVLSAAHCSDVFFEGSTLYIGGLNLDSGENRTVVRRVIHPNYNDDTLDNDFLVILLSSNSTKEPIEMNSDVNFPSIPGTDLTIIGFGNLLHGSDQVPDRLQEAVVDFVVDSSCERAYRNELTPSIMLCASSPGKDSCEGDSGGPIFTDGRQVGVMSWGYACADPNFPGVYAEVAPVYDWIIRTGCSIGGMASFCDDLPVVEDEISAASQVKGERKRHLLPLLFATFWIFSAR